MIGIDGYLRIREDMLCYFSGEMVGLTELQICNDHLGLLLTFCPPVLFWDFKIETLNFTPQGGRVYA